MPISRASLAEALSVEQNRRRYILLFVSYITSAIMLVLGLRHLLSEDYLLQFILFGCAFSFLLNAAWFHARGSLQRLDGTARTLMGVSTAIWLSVLTCGRWIGYV